MKVNSSINNKPYLPSVEGVIIHAASPRHRPILRGIASVTCFALTVTQIPVSFLPQAYAYQINQSGNIANLGNLSNVPVEFLSEAIDRWEKEHRQKALVFRYQSEMNSAAARYHVDQQVRSLQAETARGIQSSHDLAARAAGTIQNLASAVTEFTYSITLDARAAGGSYRTLYTDGLPTTVQGQPVLSDQGHLLFQTTKMTYFKDTRLLKSYEALQRNAKTGLLHRIIRYNVKEYLSGSKWYAQPESESAYRREKLTESEVTDFFTVTEKMRDWVEAEIARAEQEIAAGKATLLNRAYAEDMKRALGDGSFDVGREFTRTSHSEREYTEWIGSTGVAYKQKTTDSSGMVVESQVKVGYENPKDSSKLIIYDEEGTQKSLLGTQKEAEYIARILTDQLNDPQGTEQSKAMAREALAQYVAQSWVKVVDGRVESAVPAEGLYSQIQFKRHQDHFEYGDAERGEMATGWQETFENLTTGVLTAATVNRRFDSEGGLAEERRDSSRIWKTKEEELEILWGVVNEIEANPDAIEAEKRYAKALKEDLLSGRVAAGRVQTRQTQSVTEVQERDDHFRPLVTRETTTENGRETVSLIRVLYDDKERHRFRDRKSVV